MFQQTSSYLFVFFVVLTTCRCHVPSVDAPAGALTANRYNAPDPATHNVNTDKASHHQPNLPHQHVPNIPNNQHGNLHAPAAYPAPIVATGSGHIDKRNSYNLLSEAMSQAVSNEFSSLGSGSADGACLADDLECYNIQDRLGMEAIRTLHRQLDDDDNGNIDLSESDDFLREELKYDSGYEKRQKAFHFNDDMHISVKELWEAWLRSEVHNWTIEQTTDWLAQSVQLPQYVELFKLHKVTGAALPRLAVNNMHYVGNVLGIKDPIHKQKIALKAMDVVLFGPPRETGTRWKDYILVTLLLSAIIGCWYAYQQNKNAKRHLRRMAQDMEGLQRAEQSLQEMQKELEKARMEQESVETEKMDLERRLKEAPMLSSSSSDLEVQQLKKEIEMLRNELSRAEIELVDNCWTPPPQLQSWLQYTYELESKNHLKKRMNAEKQLQSAREACEKLRKKRSSLVGAFVSTHGKSIDDVDRSIVEARNSLGEVTNELQERLHRWKQIESCLGFNIVNNNGLPYLESVLYSRNGGLGNTISNKGSRGRITSSTDDLDDESVQGIFDSYSRNSLLLNNNNSNAPYRDDSSSDDGINDSVSNVQFYLGNAPTPPTLTAAPDRPMRATQFCPESGTVALDNHNANSIGNCLTPLTNTTTMTTTAPSSTATPPTFPTLHFNNAQQYSNFNSNDSQTNAPATLDENRHSPSVSSEGSIPVPPRSKKQNHSSDVSSSSSVVGVLGQTPKPPPRKAFQSQLLRSPNSELVPMEIKYFAPRQQQSIQQQQQQLAVVSGSGSATVATTSGGISKKMVKQHSTASQQSSSSTSSSVQSAPPSATTTGHNENGGVGGGGGALIGQFNDRWYSQERVVCNHGHHEQLQLPLLSTGRRKFYERNNGDKEPMQQQQQLQQQQLFNKTYNLPSAAGTNFSYDNNPEYGIGYSAGTYAHIHTPATAPASPETPPVTTSYSNTELEVCQKKQAYDASVGNASAANIDTHSLCSDTISLDGSISGIKKRRRRLRFPFGSSKKSNSSTNSSNSKTEGATTTSSSSKAKHA